MSQQNPHLTQEQILRILDPLNLTQNYNTYPMKHKQSASETIDLILGNPTVFNTLNRYSQFLQDLRPEDAYPQPTTQGAAGSQMIDEDNR